MHIDLYHWLFDDPQTAGGGPNGGPEVFHFLWPWLIFCCAGLLITFYYTFEGRKRFVKSRHLVKYMLDRYLGWLAIICFIGLPIIFACLPGWILLRLAFLALFVAARPGRLGY